MNLYLVQHAEAKSKTDDTARPLTTKGWSDIRKVIVYLGNLRKFSLRKIFHSEKKRAYQTAHVIGDHLEPSDGVHQADGLKPNDDPMVWTKYIMKLEEDIMIVGHLPHLSKLAAFLITGDMNKEPVVFNNAGVVCLQRDGEGNWRVGWIITPDIIVE